MASEPPAGPVSDPRADSAGSATAPVVDRSARVQPAAPARKDGGAGGRGAGDDAPPSDVILRARGVTKRFGGLTAVDRMDVDVRRGQLVGLIGPNGAGKSTFFNCLTGYTAEDEGAVWFEGKRIEALPMWRIAREGLVRTFQLTKPLARMTVLENLMLAPPKQTGETLLGALRPLKVRKQEEEIRQKALETLEFFDLTHVAHEYAGALSGGQKKLLELARALMLDPAMMLLDEPMAGVNPTLAKKLMDRIETLRLERGVTFLLVEHDMETVFRYCDPIVVMAEGRKLAEGAAEDIRNNRAVQDAYLGG